MERYGLNGIESKARIDVGVDQHLYRWHVTILDRDVELFCGNIPGQWPALRSLLDRYGTGKEIVVVYEAGYFGYWLYDCVRSYGAKCIVTPPSLIPREPGNQVKTNRRDSRKLAYYSVHGMLKAVHVPTPEERYHRQVVRRRQQFIADRRRVQQRIKAELRAYGIGLVNTGKTWTRRYEEELSRLRFDDRFMEESFKRMLNQYENLKKGIKDQTALVRELAKTDYYRERVEIMTSTAGIGVLSAMQFLVEIQDVARFRRADQLSSYVGLTPSQYSSGEHVRMGRITCAGKAMIRSMLVEASWILIRKDGAMRLKYEAIKARSGSKRAIVAIARMLLLRIRHMLIHKESYVVGLTG
jgi:transposase